MNIGLQVNSLHQWSSDEVLLQNCIKIRCYLWCKREL